MKIIILCLPLLILFCVTESKAKGKCLKSEVTCIPTHYWSVDACECVPQKQSAGSIVGNAAVPAITTTAAEEFVKKCQIAQLEAVDRCDETKDGGVQSAQTTLSNFAVGMGSQMGIQGACSGLGTVLTGANAAVATFSAMCTFSRKKCLSSCEEARAALKASVMESVYGGQIDQNLISCDGLSASVDRAAQAMQNVKNTISGAESCAKQAGIELYDFCKTNPTAPGCATAATDCSNPDIAKANPICICKNNPNSETCTGASLKANSGFSPGGYDPGSIAALNSGTQSGTTNLDSDGFMGDVGFTGNPNLKSDPTRAEDVGGSKGGRPLGEGGGGGGGGPGDGGGSGGASSLNVAVNAGFRGGGGGGGGAWSSGGSGAGSGTGGVPSSAQVRGANPDLRQFLPGGKFDPKQRRGLAGLSGPDGITGPHSDIWKKIQNRYQIEQIKLMP